MRLSTRQVLPAMLTSLPVIGAVLGAGLHPAPSNHYLAEAALVIPPGSALSPSAVEAIARLPVAVSGQADPAAKVPRGFRDDVTLRTNTSQRLITIGLRGASPERAVAMADDYASQLAFLAQRIATGDQSLVLGDFEHALENWGAQSQFNAPPVSLDVVAHGVTGRRALQIRCRTAAACGPATRFSYPFQAGTPYSVTAWLRSSDRARVVLLFGSSPKDYKASASVTLEPGWKRASVTWVPRERTNSAEFGAQALGQRSVTYVIDGVRMAASRHLRRQGPVRSGLPSAAERAAFAPDRRILVIPAHYRGEVQPNTAVWALVGLASGLLVSVTAGGLALAARRRQRDADERPHGQVEPIARDHGAGHSDEERGEYMDRGPIQTAKDATREDDENRAEEAQPGQETKQSGIDQGGSPQALSREESRTRLTTEKRELD